MFEKGKSMVKRGSPIEPKTVLSKDRARNHVGSCMKPCKAVVSLFWQQRYQRQSRFCLMTRLKEQDVWRASNADFEMLICGKQVFVSGE